MEQHSSGHVGCDPDRCFAAKMAYLRENGLAIRIPQGWRGPSVQARARQEIEDAKANGRQIESASSKYYGPVSV